MSDIKITDPSQGNIVINTQSPTLQERIEALNGTDVVVPGSRMAEALSIIDELQWEMREVAVCLSGQHAALMYDASNHLPECQICELLARHKATT